MILAAMEVVFMVNEAAIGWRSVSTRGGASTSTKSMETSHNGYQRASFIRLAMTGRGCTSG